MRELSDPAEGRSAWSAQRFDSYSTFYRAAYHHAIIEERSAGWVGATLMSLNRSRGDWSDAAVPELVIAISRGPYSIAELAAMCGLSSAHFARAFKASTGLPPHAWQRRLRIDRATALLETTDLPVTAIALAVGYETSQALARLFAREVGRTPSHWRRERRR